MTGVPKHHSTICLATKIPIIQARVTSVIMDDYVSVDQEAITSESLTDAIVVSVKFSSESLAESEDVGSEEPHPFVTAKEAQGALQTFDHY